jgi:hypothetical protein
MDPSRVRYPVASRVQRTVIGVACAEHERHVVQEFFELFKTPWEIWQPDTAYAVLIVSGRSPPPPLEATLTIVFGAHAHTVDAALGLNVLPLHDVSVVEVGSVEMPIYGDCASFTANGSRSMSISSGGEVVVELTAGRVSTIRCGYDLFAEVEFLLTAGQPTENAHIATLDVHIDLLRTWILEAGIPLVEVPPAPAGSDFLVCLTHDIDFLDIRREGFDRTIMGFLYRALVGSFVDLAAGRSSWSRVARNWKAAAALPFVHLGLARDPWSPFEHYLAAEGDDFRSTFFVIPFRDRAGMRVASPVASRRAVRYDVDDIGDWVRRLEELGFEVAVHGIDAWCSEARGREELGRVAAITGSDEVGIRMHWLCYDEAAPARLEAAGYAYDSTSGYNDAIGFKAGTSQAFRPLGTSRLLELPLHIQDTALFFPRRLHLSEDEAALRCQTIRQSVERHGGVLTILWHERSLAPERQWGDFYGRLLETLRERSTWFGTARDVVQFFRRRRALTLGEPTFDGRSVLVPVHDDHEGSPEGPAPCVRVHLPGTGNGRRNYVDVPYTGGEMMTIELGGERVA